MKGKFMRNMISIKKIHRKELDEKEIQIQRLEEYISTLQNEIRILRNNSYSETLSNKN